MVSVAPNFWASSNRSSFMSNAIIRDASNAAATWMMFNPTPPTATTATVVPGTILEAFRTAPTAVSTLQPSIAEAANGR